MPIKKSIRTFFQKPIFNQTRTILVIWIGLALFYGIVRTLSGHLHNNYQIYKYVYFNILDRFPLYQPRPEFYGDVNHYGPIFGLLIAPFALLPDIVGCTLWLITLGLLLYFSIKELHLEKRQIMAIFWISSNMLISAYINVQFNIATLALIILSYTCIRKEKDIWAAFAIMLGTFVKLYGIVGFAFFFFSKNKPKLVIWSLIWAVVFFTLPMLISSPEYIIAQYKGWFHELMIKNSGNNMSINQNISFLGMVRKISADNEMSNLPMILGALGLFAIPYSRFKEFKQDRFQLLMLASVLLFTVLFSTGSEPTTYIVAICGVGIWFVIQPRPLSKWNLFLIIFAIILSGFCTSDLFPRTFYRQYILPNALQALPCTLVWLTIVYEMTFVKSDKYLTGKTL